MKEIKREILETKDGSKTLYIPEMDETYHSHHGALTESQHIFIETGLKAITKSEIKIFEVGFGTGLNAILTFLNKGDKVIQYDSIELYPLSKEAIQLVDYASLIDCNVEVFHQMHEIDWNESIQMDDQFALRKIEGDFTIHQYDNQYDLIYFDAFAPNKQEEMWTEDLLRDLYEACNDGAILVTYCVRGTVKRALKAVGFEIEKLPGPVNGKREMLRAWKK